MITSTFFVDTDVRSSVAHPLEGGPTISERRRRPSRAAISSASAESRSSSLVAESDGGAWYRVDLHLHTPASIDYVDVDATPLDLLRAAKDRGLDIIALTDHNSVAGWHTLQREIRQLTYLESLGRLLPEEAEELAEYRTLTSQILVLPGFEFTATFGFHILAIFSERTSTRLMEHLLLTLNVPEDRFGSGEVGATTDVLRAYEVLHDHGAIVIGAHVNSTHGVAMRGIKFAGQTKIAYTQDAHLHALEVTDLTVPGRRTTASFFDGSRAEYPRRMHCIQGSDAHRIHRDPKRDTNLGIGERATELQLSERSFAAMKALFESERWDAIRPARMGGPASSALHAAREEGPGPQVAFHHSLTVGKQPLTPVIRDIVAMANGNGGVLYLGVGPIARKAVAGVTDTPALIESLRELAANEIEPHPELGVAAIDYEGKTVVAINVAPGTDRPYALATGEILVRQGETTELARREEILRLVRGEAATPAGPRTTIQPPRPEPETLPSPTTSLDTVAPRSGVEIVDVQDIDGVLHYTMRDLRNGSITTDVTASTGRKLWSYAIKEREKKLPDAGHIRWRGDLGFWKVYRASRNERRYNLAYRLGPDDFRIFYGVSEDGLSDEWRAVTPRQRSDSDEDMDELNGNR